MVPGSSESILIAARQVLAHRVRRGASLQSPQRAVILDGAAGRSSKWFNALTFRLRSSRPASPTLRCGVDSSDGQSAPPVHDGPMASSIPVPIGQKSGKIARQSLPFTVEQSQFGQVRVGASADVASWK